MINNEIMNRIFFAGNGHGAVAALTSLLATFDEIEVVSDDPAVLEICRSGQDKIVGNIEATRSKNGVLAGYQKILAPSILKEKYVINVHYSILPKYRGMHSVVWSILNGDEYIGLSVHEVTPYIDSGPILFQSKILYEGQTSAEIFNRLNKLVVENLGRISARVFSRELRGIPQDNELATWVPKRNKEDCIIDFNGTASYLTRFFKALVVPYPLPYFEYRDNRFEVLDYEIIHRPYICTTGRIVNIDPVGAYVKISDGLLIIKLVRDDNGDVLVPNATIFKIGSRLG